MEELYIKAKSDGIRYVGKHKNLDSGLKKKLREGKAVKVTRDQLQYMVAGSYEEVEPSSSKKEKSAKKDSDKIEKLTKKESK